MRTIVETERVKVEKDDDGAYHVSHDGNLVIICIHTNMKSKNWRAKHE